MTGTAKKHIPRKRVAVMRLSALGDVAIALPVLYAACRRYPDTDFVFVTKKAFAGLVTCRPDNLTVVAADTKGRHKGLPGLVRLARELRCSQLIDLHDVLRSKVVRTLLRASGVRVTVFDKARAAKRRLIGSGATEAEAVSPTATRYAAAFARAGYPVAPSGPVPVDLALAQKEGIPVKESDEKWVGIAPFAAHFTKVYPTGSLMHVARKLLDTRENVHLLLFGGGKDETEKLRIFATGLPRTTVVAGRGLGFAGELALMSQLDVMISMDSGNMHMAAIAGADTVSIWGPTHPACGFTPVQCRPDQRHIFVQSDYGYRRPCSVFGEKPCTVGCVPGASPAEVPCMKAITPEDVLTAVNSILDTPRNNRT